jgi:hypothetical protein
LPFRSLIATRSGVFQSRVPDWSRRKATVKPGH